MKTFKIFVPLIAGLFFCFNYGLAQDMEPKKHENLQWYYITYIKFEDGKAADAKKIIKDYFIPTDQDAGHQGPVLELDLLFSDWDLMAVFPIEDGIQALEWETSPRDVDWLKAFTKRAGSEEKAKEIQKEFSSYIRDHKNQLAKNMN